MGPMTGRGAGYCAGYDAPGTMNPMPGRGFGMGWGGGWGRGRGWRHGYYATGLPGWARFGPVRGWAYGSYARPLTKEQEIDSLKAQAGWLKEQLDAINQCLTELEQEE
jgi:hypothetical protein